MKKRYLVFVCEQYYPSGGWSDLKDSFDTAEEATSYANARKKSDNWVQIVDKDIGIVLDEF